MIDAQAKARKYRLWDGVGDGVRADTGRLFDINVLDVEAFFGMPRPTFRARAVPRKLLTLRDKPRETGAYASSADSAQSSPASRPAARAVACASGSAPDVPHKDRDIPLIAADDPPEPRRSFAFPHGEGVSQYPPEVVAQYSRAAERIEDFFNWYRGLPDDFVNLMIAEGRRRIANAFGAEFARVKETRVELKAQGSVASVAAAHGKVPKFVKIYSASVRRWLVRHFQYTQRQVYQRSFTPEGKAKNDAWIAESEARVRLLASTHPEAIQSDLYTRGYFVAEVHVAHFHLERVLGVMLQLDKVLARMEVDEGVYGIDPILAQVTEPLDWLRTEHAREPLAKYPVSKPSPFIRQAAQNGERVARASKPDVAL